ncbi:MAG: hypothetical protein A3H27_06115 [Acidobacteria bacterium RIFCSPLOWO2_02_FULL_59_13]|nr:MAG: hypothetical protein A3H27_06115 [Acidobacteria bacterium RIFCSPLOWO2_02_FULL_59_13]
MGMLMSKKIAALLAGGMLLGTGWLLGQQTATTQTTLLHVFAYTPVAEATQQDFDNFKKATADMVGKVPGLRRVWVGKLKAPLGEGDTKRLYGVGMEFDDAMALEGYADHPAHKEWEKVYRKVRVAGTTTFDILGE